MIEHRRRGARDGDASGLRECRRRIESLAGGGRFVVACARTGESPAPVAGLRFPDRRAATAAARLTRVYRDTFRRWDPETPWQDPVVHERRAPESSSASQPGESAAAPTDLPATGGEP